MLSAERIALLKHGAPPRNALEAALRNAWGGGGASYEKTVGPAPILSISDAKPKSAKSLIVGMEPIQAGSGEPSPDNIRPITGRTGVTAFRTGKNLWDASQMTESATWVNVVLQLPPGQYTMSTDKPDNNGLPVYFRRLSQSQGAATSVYSGHPVTRSLSDANDPLQVSFRRASGTDVFSNYKFQIELGSTESAYEPYSGNTYPVSWQTEAGTVYGGTVDVVSGVLTVTDAEIASYNGETLPSTWISDRDVYAEGTTPTIGAQVVYELATPQTYQLTPQQIQLLKGSNTLWSDGDSLTLTYIGTQPANLLGGMLGGGFGNPQEPTEETSEEPTEGEDE